MDESVGLVASAEAGDQMVSRLVHTTRKVSSEPYVQRSEAIRHDIYPIGFQRLGAYARPTTEFALAPSKASLVDYMCRAAEPLCYLGDGDPTFMPRWIGSAGMRGRRHPERSEGTDDRQSRHYVSRVQYLPHPISRPGQTTRRPRTVRLPSIPLKKMNVTRSTS